MYTNVITNWCNVRRSKVTVYFVTEQIVIFFDWKRNVSDPSYIKRIANSEHMQEKTTVGLHCIYSCEVGAKDDCFNWVLNCW